MPLHGYSGRWHLEVSFTCWRERQLETPDFVTAVGHLDLHIPADGPPGFGSVLANMTIRIGKYRAEDSPLKLQGTNKMHAVKHLFDHAKVSLKKLL